MSRTPSVVALALAAAFSARAASAAAEPTADALKFLVIGDWGWIPGVGVGNATQIAVAKQMAATAGANNVSFVVSTGDNIYDYGVMNDTDPEWERFTKIYNHTELQVPWYVALGNHDMAGFHECAGHPGGACPGGVRGNWTAQINWSHTPTGDWRWTMPNQWFESPSYSVPGDAGGASLRVVVTQTTTSSIVRNVTMAEAKKEQHQVYDQLAWLNTSLPKRHPNEWVIAVGHHPHGELYWLAEYMRAHKTPVYLCGHAHIMATYNLSTTEPAGCPHRCNPDFGGVEFISGAGGIPREASCDADPGYDDASCAHGYDGGVRAGGTNMTANATYYSGLPGFGLVSVTADELRFQHILWNGTVGSETVVPFA